MNTDLMPVYPGSSVPINKAGLKDPEALATFEAAIVRARAIELDEKPISPTFDRAHLKEMHRRLFQDVYAWAGELRSAPFPDRPSVLRSSFNPSPTQSVQAFGDAILREVRSDSTLRPLDKESFVTAIASQYDRLSYWRPFASGNSRTLNLFVRQISETAGYRMALSPDIRESLSKALVAASYDELAPMRGVFRSILTPQRAFVFAQNDKQGENDHVIVRFHPELKGTYQLLSEAREQLGYENGRFPDASLERRYDHVVKHFQRVLDKGVLPETSHPQALEQALWVTRGHER